MRSSILIATLALVMTCGLFALAKAAPSDALRDYQEHLIASPQSCLGCRCMACRCGCP